MVSINHINDEKCRICDLPANGLHFSCLTCRACAEFFRRSVIDKKQYECLRDGNCKMQKAMRYSCKFCRLKQCLSNGMKPECNTCVQVVRRRQKIDKNCINGDFSEITSTKCKFEGIEACPQMTILEMPSTQLKLIETMSTGIYNYQMQQRSLFTLLYPDSDPDTYEIVCYTRYIKMARGCTSIVFSTLNDYFPLFRELDLKVKETFMRTFNIHFSTLFQCYQTMIHYPAIDDHRFVLHTGQLITCEHLTEFHCCNKEQEHAIKHTAQIGDSCGHLVDKMRELKIRRVEIASIIGIKMWNELALLSKNLCSRAELERSRIYKDLYNNIELHYGILKAGPRLGSLILLINDLDMIADKIVEIFIMGRVFNLFEITLFDD